LESCLEPCAARQLRDDLRADARLGLALPGVYADVYPDGWAPRTLLVRLAKRPADALLRLRCAHQWPTYAPLGLRLCPSWGGESWVEVPQPGPFTLEIPLADAPPGEVATVQITAERVFVPTLGPQGGDDRRELAFLLCGLELL
jgi:hypothetical protein